MSCSMEIIQFYEECEREELEKIEEEKEEEEEWEVYYNKNVGHCDDHYKLDKNTSIDEVKEKCKELGSRLFIASQNRMYYIRSPPWKKKNRDYESLKHKLNSQPENSNYNSYLLNY